MRFAKKSTRNGCAILRIGAKPREPRGKWTEPSVRGALIQAFQKNCGYCGRFASTKGARGEVDHFLPKKLDREEKTFRRLYDWENLIWSCHDCNAVKLDYNDPNCTLLNPCHEEDVALLCYLESHGTFALKPEFRADEVLQKRYRATQERTTLNDDEYVSERRKLAFDQFVSKLKGLKQQKALRDLECSSNYEEKKKEVLAFKITEFKLLFKWLLSKPEYKDLPIAPSDFGIK